jgi:hypothetical protein
MPLSPPVRNLLRVASSLDDPLLAYELERNVLSLAGLRKVRRAVTNPGVQTWEEHVEGMVAVLKSLEKEMEDAISEAEFTNDLNEVDRKIEEFSILFKQTAEEERLMEFLRNTSLLGKTASGTAGVKDFLKNIWRSVTDGGEEESEGGMSPSYTLDEDTMDAIVEGKANWMDSSQYIEREFKENKDFFSGAQEMLDQMGQVRKDLKTGYSLDVGFLKEILEKIRGLVKQGGDMLRGIRQHLKEPVPQVILEDDEDEAPKEAEAPSLGPWGLEGTVEHYLDVLRDNLGDEDRLLKLLKELFRKVKPLVEGEAAVAARVEAQRAVLPVLVRLAYARPHLRPAFVPIIRRAVGR